MRNVLLKVERLALKALGSQGLSFSALGTTRSTLT